MKFFILLIIAFSVLSAVLSLAAARVDRWPGGLVYYVKNVNHPFWSNIESKINQINQRTQVKWVERTNQPSYVVFTNNAGGNYATLGYYGAQVHTLNLSGNYRVIHEMLHIMGFIHEQQRSDRDNFIEFDFKYLDKNKAWNKSNMLNVVSDSINLTPYDINSCMHYWSSAGGSKLIWYDFINPFIARFNNEYVTMYFKQDRGNRFNTNEDLSKLDIEGINKHYSGSFGTKAKARLRKENNKKTFVKSEKTEKRISKLK